MSDLSRDIRLNNIYHLLLIRCGYEAGIVSKKDYRGYVLNDMCAAGFFLKNSPKYQKAKKKEKQNDQLS